MPPRSSGLLAAATATSVAVGISLLSTPAAADVRDLEQACPTDRIEAHGFRDLTGSVHEDAVSCVAHWEVAKGRTASSYDPAGAVTRGQAASFVARLVEQSGGALPAPTRRHFTDVDGSTHEDSINRLAEAGVVNGRTDGTYGPDVPMTRAQMAALLVRGYDHRAPQSDRSRLPDGPNAFDDDDGHVLEPEIDKAAAAGFAAGTGTRTFAPGRLVRRDQMASFLARTLDLIVAEGMAAVPPPPGRPVTVVAAADIACPPGMPETTTTCKHARTADLVEAVDPHAVLLPGDVQNEDGSIAEFTEPGGWTGTWSRFLDRSWPAPGNHEWQTAGAAGYRHVFDERTGGRFWYSVDIGGWHVVSLSSDCEKVGGCGVGSPQHDWFVQDLATHDGKPTLVFWHHPRFSAGWTGQLTQVDAFWRTAAADPDVQLVLWGHDHSYQRLAPRDANGQLDPAGLRAFDVGTGGQDLHCWDRHADAVDAEVYDCTSFGVLRLELRPDGYDWQFVAATGSQDDRGSSGLRPRP
jgi:hypothetical protein